MSGAETVPAAVRADVLGDRPYVLATVDELVYGYHAVFVLIHLLLEADKRRDMKVF